MLNSGSMIASVRNIYSGKPSLDLWPMTDNYPVTRFHRLGQRQDVDLKDLAIFVRVAEDGDFSAVARTLSLTPSTVSK